MPASSTCDVIVIGCSAGGVEALPRLLHPLPDDLPASIFIAQHLGVTENPYLVDILRRSTRLPVAWAEQGDRLEHAHIKVAPPDTHMLFTDHHVRLTHGPRENHARPSIDKLFRSAAAEHGGRVIGVLLTGMLGDGVNGLRAIRDAGGTTIVQDPADAAFPELPRRALEASAADRVMPLQAIPSALVHLCVQPAGESRASRALDVEVTMDRTELSTPTQLAQLGPQTPISCPECHGPMWLIGNEHDRHYRCYNGHVIAARELLVQEGLEVESALWSAVRALTDRAMTLEQLGEDSQKTGHAGAAELYFQRAKETRAQAELARKFLVDVVRPV